MIELLEVYILLPMRNEGKSAKNRRLQEGDRHHRVRLDWRDNNKDKETFVHCTNLNIIYTGDHFV
jgi:hypothetical protein